MGINHKRLEDFCLKKLKHFESPRLLTITQNLKATLAHKNARESFSLNKKILQLKLEPPDNKIVLDNCLSVIYSQISRHHAFINVVLKAL